MWAAITPYALEYDRLLLYGVAALTNVRVGSREHGVSASVAGSLIGYALGRLACDARRESANPKGARLAVGPNMVGVEWQDPLK
jgi:hypothetical protein